MWISTKSFDLKQRARDHETDPLFGAAIGPGAPRRRDQTPTVPRRFAPLRSGARRSVAPLREETEKPGAISRQPAAIA